MPVKTVKRGDEWCVQDPDGSIVKGGCHDTEQKAKDHAAAINANMEKMAISFDEIDAIKSVVDNTQRASELTGNFNSIIWNIAVNDDIPDKAGVIRDVTEQYIVRLQAISPQMPTTKEVLSAADKNNLPDSSFLFIEPGGEKDSEGKTFPRGLRHLPFKDGSGKLMLPQLRNAIARADQIKMQDGSNISKAIASRLQESARKILQGATGKKQVDGIFNKALTAVTDAFNQSRVEGSELLIWKEMDGPYRWIARYSNNRRDNDRVPEIISGESHRKFVKLVDEGFVAPPSLVIWHENDSLEIGQSEWVAYDDSGFAIAGGYFHQELGDLPQAIKALDDVLLSHGMPVWSVARDESDPTIITQHITQEISLLPGWAAANKWTGFEVLER